MHVAISKGFLDFFEFRKELVFFRKTIKIQAKIKQPTYYVHFKEVTT
jgi:hypothetical protein